MNAFQSLVPASVFVEWRAQSGLEVRDILGLRECSSMCCDLYHVHLQECYFNETGSRHICQFSAPDAESVRAALRATQVRADGIWAGRIYDLRKQMSGNVAIEWSLKRQRRKNMIDTLLEIENEWEREYGLQLARAMISLDNKRALFLCYADDHEAIDRVIAQMCLQGTTVWPYRLLTDETG